MSGHALKSEPAFSPRSTTTRNSAALHGVLKSNHASTLLPPPQFHHAAFGASDDISGRRSGDIGLGSSQSNSSGSGIDYSTKNSHDSSEDDAVMRNFTSRVFGSDEAGYQNSSTSGNSSLGSAEFSFMVSPVLGRTVASVHGVTPAAAALPGANLSTDALNFTWTNHSAAKSPRPSSQQAPMVNAGQHAAPVTVSGARDTPHSRMCTPNTQLPLFGASPVPVAPTSTFTAGNGYLTMIDTGLPCDITPLTSLSSPGGPSDDSNWKWDPSQNSLMNLASLSQCVLSTDASPTPMVAGVGRSCSSELSSISSVLFANGSGLGGGGGLRRNGHDSSRCHSIRTGGSGDAVEGSSPSVAARLTPSSMVKSSRPQPDTGERQVYLHHRSLDSTGTPTSSAYSSPMEVTAVGRPSSSGSAAAKAHRGSFSPGKCTHDMNPPAVVVHPQPQQPGSQKMLRSSVASSSNMRADSPTISTVALSSVSGDDEADGPGEKCSMEPPATGGHTSLLSVAASLEPIVSGEGASGIVGQQKLLPEKEDNTDQEESGRSPATRKSNNRKRKLHHRCSRAAAEADDNIMRVAIGDVKRLRMLSPAVNAANFISSSSSAVEVKGEATAEQASKKGEDKMACGSGTASEGRRLTRRSTGACVGSIAPHRHLHPNGGTSAPDTD